MAFFKFRKGGDEQLAPPPQPESVEALRKRARHRLIGAALLVLAGVIGFPLLFDAQPRPIAVDIPIEIPDKSKARPIAIAPMPAAPAPAAVVESAGAPPVSAPAPKLPETAAKAAETAPKAPVAKDTAVLPKLRDKTAVALAKPSQDAIKKEAMKSPQENRDGTDSAKAQALLDGGGADKSKPSSASSDSRFVVQIGAFADAARAKEARSKLERAGLKTYTTVVETKDGQRTRVRVGPFADKNDADAAASKIKALDLPAAILVL